MNIERIKKKKRKVFSYFYDFSGDILHINYSEAD